MTPLYPPLLRTKRTNRTLPNGNPNPKQTSASLAGKKR